MGGAREGVHRHRAQSPALRPRLQHPGPVGGVRAARDAAGEGRHPAPRPGLVRCLSLCGLWRGLEGKWSRRVVAKLAKLAKGS